MRLGRCESEDVVGGDLATRTGNDAAAAATDGAAGGREPVGDRGWYPARMSVLRRLCPVLRSCSIAIGALVLGAAACGQPAPTAPTDIDASAPPVVVLEGTPVTDPGAWLAGRELAMGVQIFEADVNTPALEQLRGAGMTWARTRVLWKLVEPREETPPVYDWTVTDELIGAATGAGFRNVTVVYANPDWAAATECGAPMPDKMERYAAFWQALVERYDSDGVDDAPNGATVKYWEVGNEPDFDPSAPGVEGDYGSCFGNDPAAYGELLVAAYRAIKAADPEARVGFGALAYDRFTAASAPTGWTSAPGPFVYDFTQAAFAALYEAHAEDEALPFCDFVGIHNYNDSADFWDSPPQREMVAKIDRFRNEQLVAPGVYDLRDIPLLLSETGLATSPSDEWTERSEHLQAMYVGQTMVRAMAVDAIAAIWYTARDNIFGDCAPPHHDWLTFGLMRSPEYAQALAERCPMQDWVEPYTTETAADARPALMALTVVASVIAGTEFDRQLTDAETGDAAIEAYRFVDAEGRSIVAAWTTTGERLGKIGVEPIETTLALGADTISPWNGRVVVADHMGASREFGQAGAQTVSVPVGQAPIYVASNQW